MILQTARLKKKLKEATDADIGNLAKVTDLATKTKQQQQQQQQHQQQQKNRISLIKRSS